MLVGKDPQHRQGGGAQSAEAPPDSVRSASSAQLMLPCLTGAPLTPAWNSAMCSFLPFTLPFGAPSPAQVNHKECPDCRACSVNDKSSSIICALKSESVSERRCLSIGLRTIVLTETGNQRRKLPPNQNSVDPSKCSNVASPPINAQQGVLLRTCRCHFGISELIRQPCVRMTLATTAVPHKPIMTPCLGCVSRKLQQSR